MLGTGTEIEIHEVTGSKDMEKFISVPWLIYQDDENWVPPLKMERKEAFSPKNPFFQHARWKAWVAYIGDKPVGRISAQIDELHLQHQHRETGFFGLIEAIDDPSVFKALFSTAEHWLREQGMTSVLGPFNLGINQEIGCLVDGFDTPPYVMMGHARPYYGSAIESMGYTKQVDVLAYGLDRNVFAMPRSIQRLLKRQSGNMQLRKINRKSIDTELEILRDIFNDAWSENWGFVPFTQTEFAAIGKELFRIVPSEYTLIGEVKGEPAAFLAMIPNLNEVISDLNGRLFPFGWLKLLWRIKLRHPKSARIALMGVRKEFQHTLLGPALAFLTIQGLYEPAMRRGLETVEMSWILEQNHAMRNIIEKIGGKVTKTYRMYGKNLS